MDFTQELMRLSAAILLATDPQERLSLSAQMNALAAQTVETDKNCTTGFLHFTQKEIAKMPKTFKKEFIINGYTTHVIKRPSGKHGHIYEIRYRRNGYNISASSKNADTAKRKFIEKLSTATPIEPPTPKSGRLIKDYAFFWLDKIKRPLIKESTYEEYATVIRAHIIPKYGDYTLEEVTSSDVQLFLYQYTDRGNHRTAQKIYVTLKAIMEYAYNDGLIKRNPLNNVTLLGYQQKNGQALTIEEERDFVAKLNAERNEIRNAYLFALYTGARRSEILTAEIKDGWITIKSVKTKKAYGDVFRRMPVPPLLKPYLSLNNLAFSADSLSRGLHKYLSGHHLHDLRHTFITRANVRVQKGNRKKLSHQGSRNSIFKKGGHKLCPPFLK